MATPRGEPGVRPVRVFPLDCFLSPGRSASGCRVFECFAVMTDRPAVGFRTREVECSAPIATHRRRREFAASAGAARSASNRIDVRINKQTESKVKRRRPACGEWGVRGRIRRRRGRCEVCGVGRRVVPRSGAWRAAAGCGFGSDPKG